MKVEDISKIKTITECEKQGHFWDGRTCAPRSLDRVLATSITNFCRFTKGDLFNQSEHLSLTGKGIGMKLTRICQFPAVHFNNERGRTLWAPDVEKMTDQTGAWYVKPLLESALGCAKNDIDKVLGTYAEIKGDVIAELTNEEKNQIGTGELNLDERIQDRISNDMEFNCSEIWDTLANNKSLLTGNWSGDEHDNYDIGREETLSTSDLRHVFKEPEEVESDEVEEIYTLQPIDVYNRNFYISRNSDKSLWDTHPNSLREIHTILNDPIANIGEIRIMPSWRLNLDWRLNLYRVRIK